MAFKFVAFLACVAVASAEYAPVAIAQPVLAKSELDDPHPQYSFNYNVEDEISGDSKSQYESRDGDFVQGQYSLNDPDGYRRTVDYTADAEHGFNAIVRREPLGVAATIKTIASGPALIKAAPAPTFIKSYTAPALLKSAAPSFVHAAPAGHLVHAAPTLHYAHAPTFVHSAPAGLTYSSAPALIKSAPVLAHAHLAAPAVVKTSFASPIISYAY